MIECNREYVVVVRDGNRQVSARAQVSYVLCHVML